MKKFPSGVAVEFFDTLDSTSLEARRRIEAGEGGPAWIIARRQTSAYGRRGRAWVQETGDFAGTLMFAPKGDAEQLGQLSFVVALALASALDEFIPPERITLKWPNDILLDGKKAAGILLEQFTVKGARLLAAGIGVNIVSAPQGMPYPVARLIDFAEAPPSPLELAARIDNHFWRYCAQWTGNGFRHIREIWLERAAGLGEAATVRLPTEEVSGVFEGLDESGAMILRMGEEKRIINAGEVFFGPA